MSRELIFNRIRKNFPGFDKKNLSVTTKGTTSVILYKKTFLTPATRYTITANTNAEFEAKLKQLFESIKNEQR